MTADLQAPMFTDETAAREALEATRWPNGPVCPHCGCTDPKAIAKVGGKKRSHRPGLYYCNACTGQFTVTVGTVFEQLQGPAYEVVAGDAPDGFLQEGHVGAPTAPPARCHIQDRLVHGPPHPKGHGGRLRRSAAAWRRRQDRSKPMKPTSASARPPLAIASSAEGRPFTKKGKSGSGAQARRWWRLVERGGKTRTFHVQQRRPRRPCATIVVEQRRASSRILLHRRKPTSTPDDRHGPSPSIETVKHSAERIRPPRRRHGGPHQHGRGRVLHLQARHDRRLPPLRRSAPASLPRRVRLPLQPPLGAWRQTMRTARSPPCAGIAGKRLTYRRTDRAAHA